MKKKLDMIMEEKNFYKKSGNGKKCKICILIVMGIEL